MIIVRLMGGLGNQMFQYALGRHLAHKHNTELKLDISFYAEENSDNDSLSRKYDLDIFDIQPDFATGDEVARLKMRVGQPFLDKVLSKIIGLKNSHIREPHFNFSESVYNAPDNVYLEGYWQSEMYFADIEPLIRSDFTFKEEMSAQANELLAQIEDSTSVCVNVRRGDFVANDYHGWFGVDYFQKAEDLIRSRLSDPSFFIFSDDIEWCEANLRFDGPMVFVNHEYAGRKFQDYLRLMAACKHFIIPNSSFAWWAVWLNQNVDRTVIAPKAWFNVPSLDTKDLIPTTWIRI